MTRLLRIPNDNDFIVTRINIFKTQIGRNISFPIAKTEQQQDQEQ